MLTTIECLYNTPLYHGWKKITTENKPEDISNVLIAMSALNNEAKWEVYYAPERVINNCTLDNQVVYIGEYVDPKLSAETINEVIKMWDKVLNVKNIVPITKYTIDELKELSIKDLKFYILAIEAYCLSLHDSMLTTQKNQHINVKDNKMYYLYVDACNVANFAKSIYSSRRKEFISIVQQM